MNVFGKATRRALAAKILNWSDPQRIRQFSLPSAADTQLGKKLFWERINYHYRLRNW
jgi:hypothetical protein